MGSLRISNAPTIGDLGIRLARRKKREAITGHTIAQTRNRLERLAFPNGFESLLTDLDEVYSDEVQQLGLPREKISQRIIAPDKEIILPSNITEPFEWVDYQQFEFDLIAKTQDMQNIRDFLRDLNPKDLNINNIPAVRCVPIEDLELVMNNIGLQETEREKLRAYVNRREETIKENSCAISNKNRIVLSNDIEEIAKLYEWAPIKVVINGLDDPDEVQEELEAAYESIICEGTDFIRIESNPQEDAILIGNYSSIFIK